MYCIFMYLKRCKKILNKKHEVYTLTDMLKVGSWTLTVTEVYCKAAKT